MNYKDLTDTIMQLMTDHDFLETVGYGEISDISFPDSEDAPDYAYGFLNPAGVSLNANSFNATYNLIVMEQVFDNEQDEIDGQALAIAIIQDLLSQMKSRTEDGWELIDIDFPVSINVFKERFQDDVVGATATITINYGKAIDGCDTPITPSP